ncbi:PLP-dependent transferase [Flaviaesturariibacter flavus]|uniref:PLP-dependent transferase n=1 Tax=Flaviaesturariibacter flavus TaxID=2502780 RepID=A0A4R1BKB2_9BACT|nr:PLP-dependent aspartate aminotransferase family protein [Flaviaesturariibacter flavus]TCJ17855.1 PLP-dependent transferase [Flaviaesturariibacter flavus]
MSGKKNTHSGFGTTAVHAGHRPDPRHAHLVPIYATSTYVYDDAEQGMRRFSGTEEGYIYGRWGSPTSNEAEDKIAALESFGLPFEVKGILHASGMAALASLFMGTLKKGDKVLTHFSLYGGTDELLGNLLPGFGVEYIVADLRDDAKIDALIASDPAIKMLYLETPANPTLQCVDLEVLIGAAKKAGLLVACDNTFATPYLQQPFKWGADFVMHSTTKFLNGHGTAIGGILLGRDMEFMSKGMTKAHRLLGGSASPFDAFLLLTGVKTLELRMERHCSNAMDVARFLDAQGAVARVNYPGLPSHPDHAVAMKQMKHPGAMLSFELKGGLQAGIDFMNKLQLCTRTVSLGTCDTLLCHPASMTHHGVAKVQREQYGITDGLIRMSVGIENIEDILEDLKQALG